MTRLFAVAGLLLLLLLLPSLLPAAQPVVIPVVLPFPGSLSYYGAGARNGALLRADEINANGGIDGRPLKIIFRDDGGNSRGAALVATELARDPGTVVVVGHLCAASTRAALPLYRPAGLPLITPVASDPAVIRSSPYLFSSACRVDCQGGFLARYARQVKKIGKIAVFFENSDYAAALERAFTEKAGGLGLQVVDSQCFAVGAVDFTARLARLKILRPEALLIIGRAPQGARLVSQARFLGLDCDFLGSEGLDDGRLLRNPAAGGLCVITSFPADRGGAMVRDFVERYRCKFALEPDWLAANTYDAVGLAARAIARVGCDRGKIRVWLAARDAPERACKGLAGAVWFDADGACLKPVFIKTVADGRWVGAEKQLP